MDQGLKQAVALFHSGKYLEFQEAMEALCTESGAQDLLFCHALIQLAVGLRLLEEFRSWSGAERMLQQALVKLESMPATHRDIRVDALVQDASFLLASLRNRSSRGWPGDFRVPKIKIRLKQ